jgi:hypothetical protein
MIGQARNSSVEIGGRAGAIRNATETTVYLFGYGTYVGNEEPPSGPFGSTWDEYDQMALEAWGQEVFDQRKADGTLRPTNPKIVLDDGRVVWGQECWWGPEDRVRDSIKDREVVIV